nr:MAG TPA: hypothetical protein [Caudoviricetes sp.]
MFGLVMVRTCVLNFYSTTTQWRNYYGISQT